MTPDGADPQQGAVTDEDLSLEYKKFFQAVSSSPSSVVITDANGVIEYVNDRFVENTGYSRAQAVGRKPNILKSGKTPSEVYDDLWAVITSGKIWRGEICNRRRNGEYYWEATAIAPIFGDDGKPTHFVAVKEDVTERRLAEQELERRQERGAILARVTHALLSEVSDVSLSEALKTLGGGLGVVRAFLFRISPDGNTIHNSHEWVAEGVSSHQENFESTPYAPFAWCLDQCRKGDAVIVSDVKDLPTKAKAFKAVLLGGNVTATLTAPIVHGGRLVGFMGVDMENAPRAWTKGDVELTERVAEILGLALLRMDAKRDMREARDMASRAEQNLLDAIESMPDGFVLYDTAGNLEICNTQFRTDYGYGEDEATRGVHFTALGNLDMSRGKVEVPNGYINEGAYLNSRLEYREKLDGTFPVRLADGRHLITRDRKTSSGGVVSIQTDITHIKRVEEDLRISERKFWSVFHASPSLMTITALEDGRFLDVNAKWTEVLGYAYTQTIGRTVMEMNVWPNMHARQRMVRAFTQDGVLTNYEGKLRTRSGELRDFLMSGARVTIDGAEHLLLVSNDITERKTIERALKNSERDVRTILDNIVETFYRTDAAGNVVMVSAAVEKLLGFQPDELIGTPLRDVYVNPAERTEFLAKLDAAGGEIRNFEGRLRRKDGREIWVSSNAHYTYDRDDNITGLEGTSRDITQQKETERALMAAKELAEQANTAKSDFLSGMSHELRTPLNAVIGFSQMMELEPEAKLTEQQREYLGIIRTSGEHLLHLINEVLDLAKIEAGRMDIRCVPVELKALISECIALVAPLADRHSVKVKDIGMPDLPHILVDRIKFKQILLNLLSNAVKYNVEGGHVKVGVSFEGEARLAIAVTDTGIGLTPESCAALFEPFQRLGAEKTEVEGTGLGLVLAKRMIEAMDGEIMVSSVSDVGSTFTIIVPIAIG